MVVYIFYLIVEEKNYLDNQIASNFLQDFIFNCVLNFSFVEAKLIYFLFILY